MSILFLVKILIFQVDNSCCYGLFMASQYLLAFACPVHSCLQVLEIVKLVNTFIIDDTHFYDVALNTNDSN